MQLLLSTCEVFAFGYCLFMSGFQMTVEKPKPKQLLRPITTGTNSAMNQSQFLAITCNSPEAREKSHVRTWYGFGFGFASHWLKNWRGSFKPITKRNNRNYLITFDSLLKTALTLLWFCQVKRDCAEEFESNNLPLIDCSWIYPDESHPNGLCKLSKFPAPWPANQLASGGKNFQFVYIFLVQWCRITVVSLPR